jgi:serine/threonine protein kinase
MSKKSTFGAEPEQLKRLLTAIGLEESSTGEQSNRTISSSPSTVKLGGSIGRYKLLSILGEGGMGVVYLAEQQRPIRRQVALKVIKPGMDSTRVIERFEAERQALALLDHPNIAHVHDAGTTENGRPYFVMEYVKGLPITEHCNNHKLTVDQRLQLFQQVC